MAATVLTTEAAKAAQIDIIPENGRYAHALHEHIVALRAGRRSGSASTKTKAEVNGSGAKPWRQKGTGRARAGYKQSPVWRGGGVVFGPNPRDYSKKVNRKVAKVALRKAFSERVKSGDILVVDAFAVKEPKTKQFVKLLGGITPEARTLVIAPQFDEKTLLAGRNVQDTRLMRALDVNSEHLLLFRKIVVTNDALSVLAQRMSLS
jgi:large subunit ribosomal protein L4